MSDTSDSDGDDVSASALPINVTVVVLGDLGRSPRMQYHTVSLLSLAHVHRVDLVGYAGSELISSLRAELAAPDSRLCVHAMPPVFGDAPAPAVALLQRFFVTRAAYKIAVQCWTLLRLLLFVVHAPHSVLVQSPPAIPTLLVVWLVCALRGARMLIDWHNYAFSLLHVGLVGRRNAPSRAAQALVAVAHAYEGALGRMAHANICVTHAMSRDLLTRWRIKAHVLHDAPPPRFKPLSLADRNAVLREFAAKLRLPQLADANTRPAVLVSSTSWGDDEDFSVLLDAIVQYDRMVAISIVAAPLPPRRGSVDVGSSSGSSSAAGSSISRSGSSALAAQAAAPVLPARQYPDVVVLITGRGDRQKEYMERFDALRLRHVTVRSVWLSANDYPRLLAAADLGLSLHYSSSGLDLPMKVVDMFGCALPVCAINFACLDELVVDGKNGYVFEDAKQLCGQMEMLLKGFPAQRVKLEYMREYIVKATPRWQTNWDKAVKRLFALRRRKLAAVTS
jgi:beta-1,4-mannosyltransferase